jgi:hypothetical protein
MRRLFGLPRQPIAPAKKKPGKKRGNKPANKPAAKAANIVNNNVVNNNDSVIIDNLKNRHINFDNAGPFIILK